MLINSDSIGIQLTQDLHDLFSLLYADDVTIFADSVVNLQRLINILHQLCQKWAMKVNIEKTKIMVFRNGCRLGYNEQWVYDGQFVEVVDKFTQNVAEL